MQCLSLVAPPGRLPLKTQPRFGQDDSIAACLAASLRANQAGFDWPTDDLFLKALRGEADEFEAETQQNPRDPKRMQGEMGDILLSALKLAQRHGIDPVQALQEATARFSARFEKMLELATKPIAQMTLQEKRDLIQAAKKALEPGH